MRILCPRTSEPTLAHSVTPLAAGVAAVLSLAFAVFATACTDYPAVVVGGSSDGGGLPTGGRGSSTGGVIDIHFGGEENVGGQSPTEAVCGNGLLEPGEICDDGETEDGDGCSGDCTEQDPDFDCSVPGQPCIDTVVCGNGVLEGDEVCDEGSDSKTAGCSEECDAISEGWSCPRPGRSCVPIPVCGDGERARGEDCDDGDLDSGDGCDSECAVEAGFFCLPGQDCVALECGDGNRTPDEECDDDNTSDGDGCSSACTVEDGFRCSSLGCKPICGDGQLRGAEACDDGDRESGDGCSAGCIVEPYYDCDDSEPSVCTSLIVCGNGVLEPGEVCDAGIPGSEGCFGPSHDNACRGFDNDLVDPPDCGNGVVEYGEECDGDGGLGGCSADCELEDGFACPAADYCYRIPECGDGIVQPGEECDVGAVSSVPCQSCEVQDGYYCSGAAPSVCVVVDCGDGILAPGEQCDDGNSVSTDGCDQCLVQSGWVCPPGFPCQPTCGDGIRRGGEQCDTTDEGCTDCRVDPGYDCGTSGTSCHATECGDGDQEYGEGCDDGNLVAGDGCGPTCQAEPVVTVGPSPVVAITCGDGLQTGTEGCDDGNQENGDGCSSTCTVEPGWYCDPEVAYPSSVEFAVTYRDFKAREENGGHPDFQWNNESAANMVGRPCTTSNPDDCGRLDADGKPVFQLSNGTADVTSPTTFGLWYRNNNSNAVTGRHGVIQMCHVQDSIRLGQVGGTGSDVYQFADSTFFPIGSDCFGLYDSWSDNFHFTTELRYFFQYKGGETLSFRGDDDVWVFINGRLAVDIGGVHGVRYGRVVLGDDGTGPATDSDCSVHESASAPGACSLEASELASDRDERFNLTKGGVYEIVLFHAERHTSASNFQLTMAGFIAPRSFCRTHCGDEVVAGTELCDAGAEGAAPNANPDTSDVNVDGVYGQCDTSCSFTFCGDADQNGGEACDNGLNVDSYVTSLGSGHCAPGCAEPGYCGDGVLQSAYEVCDDGAAANTGGYGACKSDCSGLGGYCGDGDVNGGEVCDPGTGNFVTYGDDENACGFDCQRAPHCGDGIRNGTEQCDGTEGCNGDCEFTPFCGDGVKASDEECDYGDFAYVGEPEDAPYSGCTNECLAGPYCGDGTVHELEECDDGDDNVAGEYDSCTPNCVLGPRCGDAITQEIFGEDCDNGYNEDTYAYVSDACGPDCTAVPYCGDGLVDSGFELCDNGSDNDDGAYDGCTTACDWGPYCGDGVVQEAYETCDLGTDNSAYSPDGVGCGYDCQPSPYCGDGVRNGPEQCDNGTDGNTGEYGGCEEDCTLAPRCGDREVQSDEGEQCDSGPRGSLSCSVDCQLRDVIE